MAITGPICRPEGLKNEHTKKKPVSKSNRLHPDKKKHQREHI